jgi:acyl-CoA thioesterase FadM
MHFSYEVIRAGDNALLAEGESTHIVVNAKFEKTSLPEPLQKAFEAAVKQH